MVEISWARPNPRWMQTRNMPNLVDLLFPAPPRSRLSSGLLVLRLIFGLAVALHGLDKMRNPFTWMGEDSWAPAVLQFLAAISECIGGAALLVGLLTPLAGFGVAATMATGAVSTHILEGDPFVRVHAPDLDEAQTLLGLPGSLVERGGSGGSWESATVYLAIAVLLMLAGPGRYSLDALIARRVHLIRRKTDE